METPTVSRVIKIDSETLQQERSKRADPTLRPVDIAREYLSGYPEGRILSQDMLPDQGFKRFYVCSDSKSAVKSLFQALPESDWNFYEVISSGNCCKLFFDIDWDNEKDCLDQQNVIQNAIHFIDLSLKKVLPERHHPIEWMVQTSSLGKKGSLHILQSSDSFYFNDVGRTMKSFVSDLCSEIESRAEEGDERAKTLVKTVRGRNNKDKECVIDLSVYSETRSFRLPYNAKRTKGIPRYLVELQNSATRTKDEKVDYIIRSLVSTSVSEDLSKRKEVTIIGTNLTPGDLEDQPNAARKRKSSRIKASSSKRQKVGQSQVCLRKVSTILSELMSITFCNDVNQL